MPLAVIRWKMMNDPNSSTRRHRLRWSRWRWLTGATWIVLLGFVAAPTHGQTEKPAEKPAAGDVHKESPPTTSDRTLGSAAPKSEAVQYVGPDTYILLDSSGK